MSTASDDERLKALIKAAIVELIEERKDLVREVLEDALEDIALARAIDEGMRGGEADGWTLLSETGLAGAYGDDEPEYSTDLITEPNPEYERR